MRLGSRRDGREGECCGGLGGAYEVCTVKAMILYTCHERFRHFENGFADCLAPPVDFLSVF